MPHPQNRRRPAALLASLSSVALLSGCGGGGENVVDLSGYLSLFAAPAPVSSLVLSDGFALANAVTGAQVNTRLNRPEYQNTQATLAWLRSYVADNTINGTLYALRSSGAAFAHQAGLTGANRTIAVSDERLSPTHEAFAGKLVTVASNLLTGDEHGTSVASVALGNSANFVGVAPGANLLFGTYNTNTDLALMGASAYNVGAVAWNNSWGFDGLFINQTGFDLAFSGSSGQAYLSSLDTYASQGVVVFAVDNDDNQISGIMDGLPYIRPSLEAGWLAVANGVPTFSGGAVSSVDLISSPCWQSARWCLVADGTWNAAVGPTNSYALTTGSSFAAPQVAGALALLSEAFPLLSPHELRIRLLASAEDDFFTPDATVELASGFNKPYSVIYGHGFLDIEAALKPIGGTAMVTSLGETVATNAPVLLTGSGFGDAVEVSLADTNVAVRDALSAGFVMPGTALTAGARPSSQAGALLAKAMRGDLAAARTATPAALSDPFAAFTGPVLSLSATDGTGSAAVLVPQGDGAMGFTLTRVLTDGPTKVELGLKLARDNGGLLSLDGEDGAAMASVALGVTQDLGNGAFMALSGEMGLTDLGGDTALGNTSSARFDAVKLTAGQSDIFTKGDRLSVGVGMPIAIASGETVLDLPVTRSGLAAGFEGVALDLAPENRQLDMELTYQTALADGVEMQLSIIHSDNFGNRAGETDTAGALAFAFRF